MPELPEVETIVRELRASDLIGKKIIHADVFWARTIAEPDAMTFIKNITNQTITEINRRGKFIVFTLSNDTLLVHLRMTGKFLLSNNMDAEIHSHERVRLTLENGIILRYEDQRKFGKWFLLKHPEMILDKLGLEPLSNEFTFTNFENLIHNYKRQIKPFLLDQNYIAGLGNIYVDEALWEAGIHPMRLVSSLTKAEVHGLYSAIKNVLLKGVENTGTSLGAKRANFYSVSGRRGENQNLLKVFRRNGLPCPKCGTIINKIVVAQRGTHFCPNCQKHPKI